MHYEITIYCTEANAAAGGCLAEYLKNSRLAAKVRILETNGPPEHLPNWGTLILLGSCNNYSKLIARLEQIAIGSVGAIATLPGSSLLVEMLPDRLKALPLTRFQTTVHEVDAITTILSVFLSKAIQEQRSKGAGAAAFSDPEDLIASTVAAYSDRDFADRYYETWKNDIPIAQLETLLRHVPKGGSILDAGCGPGHHAHWLAERGYEVVGVDLSQAALTIAQQNSASNQARFFCADIRNSFCERNSFDAVWVSASCIHVPISQVDSVLRNFNRVLRPGGHLGITMQVGRLAALEEDGRYFEGYSGADTISSMLEAVGLTSTSVTEDITQRNTRGLRHLVHWAAIVAKKPSS